MAAISIGAQQHGLVVLDDAGRPLRKAPLWNDTRGAADARDLVAALGGPEEAARRVGSVLTSSFTVAHWAWLRRAQPEIVAAARHVLLPHDYLNFRLTGAATTDRSDVSGTGWWSPCRRGVRGRRPGLDAVRLDPGYLPEVLAPSAAAGVVTKSAAEQFGLRPGAPVACGAGDNAAGALSPELCPGRSRPLARYFRDRLRTVGQAERRQHRHGRRFRQRRWPLPPPGLHAQRHGGRRPGQRMARVGPRGRGEPGRGRLSPLARGRAHAKRSRRVGDADGAAVHDRQAGHPAGCL